VIRHDAVELSLGVLEHQRQKMAITLPQRQLEQPLPVNPFEFALGVASIRFAVETIDAKNEAEPIFAVLAEARPAYRAAQQQGRAFQTAFFLDLAADASDDVFVAIEFAAQAVVLAVVRIIRPAVAVNEQDAPSIRRKDVTQGGEDGSERHDEAVNQKIKERNKEYSGTLPARYLPAAAGRRVTERPPTGPYRRRGTSTVDRAVPAAGRRPGE